MKQSAAPSHWTRIKTGHDQMGNLSAAPATVAERQGQVKKPGCLSLGLSGNQETEFLLGVAQGMARQSIGTPTDQMSRCPGDKQETRGLCDKYPLSFSLLRG